MLPLPRLLAAGTCAYAALVALMLFNQRSQVYFPTPAVEAVRGAERLVVAAADGVGLRAWVAGTGRSDPGAPVLLYFGGNAEDVADNAGAFAQAFPGFAIHLVHYRGYGGSAGAPSEPALVADAVAVHDAVRRARPQASIAVMGRSLGSGVAVQLAAARPDLEALVLVTPFDSLVEVARGHFPWLPVSLLMTERYESAALVRAGRVRTRALLVIADDDEIVPPARAEALLEALRAAGVPVQVVRLAGASHNAIDLDPRYLESVARFLRKAALSAR